jgi:hypothetical protein
MGNCVVIESRGTPECCSCGKKAQAEWADLPTSEKADWVWERESTPCTCKACHVAKVLQHAHYEKERSYYFRYKSEMYPKVAAPSRLRRIESDLSWKNGSSFLEGWRWGSVLSSSVISPKDFIYSKGFKSLRAYLPVVL